MSSPSRLLLVLVVCGILLASVEDVSGTNSNYIVVFITNINNIYSYLSIQPPLKEP